MAIVFGILQLGVLALVVVGWGAPLAGGSLHASAASRDPGSALLRSLLAGSVSIMVVLFVAAALGFYVAPVLVPLLGGLAALGWATSGGRGLAAALGRAALAFIPRTASGRPLQRFESVAVAIPGAVLAVVLLSLFVQALRPDVSWDAAVYHLTLPKRFLAHGGFYAVPLSVYGNWPLGVELLYGAALAMANQVAAKLLHLLFGLGALAVAARLAGPRAGLAAALLVLCNPVVLYEIRIAYIDLALAFYLGMAVWLLWEYLQEPRVALLWWAGLAGVGIVSAKLNGVLLFSLVALVFAGFRWRDLEGDRRLESLRRLVAELLRLGALPLVVWCAWLAKSWWFTGNPVYPLLYGVFGGPDWSVALAEQHSAWHRAIGMGRTLQDYLLLPFRVVWLGDFGYPTFDGKLSRIWALALPLALMGLRRDRLVRFLLAVSVLVFVAWAVTSQQMRLLIPILPLLGAAAARSVAGLGDRSERPAWAARSGQLLRVGLVGASCLALLLASWVYLRQTHTIFVDLVRGGGQLAEQMVPPSQRWINEHTPADAQVLLLGGNRAFFIDRETHADSFFEASQTIDFLRGAETPAEVLERLDARSIDYVLLEPQLMRRMPFPPALLEALVQEESFEPMFRGVNGRVVMRRRGQAPGASR